MQTAALTAGREIKRRKTRTGKEDNGMFKNNVFKTSVDTKQWMRAAGIRAVKTTAQAAVALIPAAVTISQVDWGMVAGTALLSGLVSLLTSVAGIPEVIQKEEP